MIYAIKIPNNFPPPTAEFINTIPFPLYFIGAISEYRVVLKGSEKP